MPELGFAPPESRQIERPLCPKCMMPTGLFHTEPHASGVDVRTFECQACEHSECRVVQDD